MATLYRQHRPQVFSDVLGQDHVRVPLENSLKQDRINHAYLFSGPRGTGKTTLARLFAKAVNCTNRGESADPCGKCAVCTEIANNASVDIIEIDAASNRGIDEVRELRDKIAFAPARSKYRVYIIDEVHMLTKEAFNALLKTLEEPPAHAIFILATTELHKVPETIISRCQRYNFHRAPADQLAGLLKKVAKKEKLNLADEVVALIAERAEGSYRDALSLLSSVVSQGGEFTPTNMRQLLGLPESARVDNLLLALESGDGQALVREIRDFLDTGGDLSVLVKSVAEKVRSRIFASDDASVQAGNAKLLEELMLILGTAKTSSDPTALILARLLNVSVQAPKAKVVEMVPEPVSQPVASPVETATVADIQKPASSAVQEVAAVDTVSSTAPKAVGDDQLWDSLLQEVKNHNHALYAVLRSAEMVGLTDDKIIIGVQFRFYGDRLHEPKNRSLIESLSSKLVDRPMRLECQITGRATSKTEESPDLVKTVVEVFEITE